MPSHRIKGKMGTYYEYILVLAITIFVIFTALFSIMITYLTKYAIKLIRYGEDDEKILKKRAYIEKQPSKQSPFAKAFSAILSLVLIAIFIFVLCISCTENEFDTGLANIKIVKSTSMERKNEKNKYLFENDLNDQFAMFDIVLTKELPGEYELELYDIVVYERDGMLVIHRIVEIEEPNAQHPNERHFKFQGDSSSRHDVYPVLYSQMKAIYEGNKIPFVGSIVLFIQAPPGWLCFILTIFAILVTPVVEKKLIEEMRKRLAVLDAMSEEPEALPAMAEPEPERIILDEPVKVTSVMAEKDEKPEPSVTDANVKVSFRFTVTDVQKKKFTTNLVVDRDEPEKKVIELKPKKNERNIISVKCSRVNVFTKDI